ncbi:Bicupin, oxalate decarboxylase/oxidase [Schizophyllum commune H4-8]|nr:Bicupin, oxalate decarboxylase/oxidase [Schizophyllum commune H4-8]KAI5892737.1 Bicupin, oxalate decarboxylase/oxidase [Schizophyllum commune H4-8]
MRYALALALASALVSAAPRPAHHQRQDTPSSATASSFQASDSLVASDTAASFSASLASLSDAVVSGSVTSASFSVPPYAVEVSPTEGQPSAAASSAAPSAASVTYGNYSGSASSVYTSSTTPAPSSSGLNSSIIPVTATVDPVKGDPDGPAFSIETGPAQPVKSGKGAPFAGPTNEKIDQQNPDFLAPPSTDFGFIGSAKWSMSLGPMRLLAGGWVRQEDETVMPLADEMAGAVIHLEPGAIRELHWHSIAEWVYVINGTTQISAVDTQGRNTFGTANTGDLWYFPPGIGHHLQATGDAPSEFVLIFKTGLFDASKTFLVTDWLAHVPFGVLQKNFGVEGTDKFTKIPSEELYIFPGEPPALDGASLPDAPQGKIPNEFVFAMSQMEPERFDGGTVKVADSSNFPASKEIAAAEVTLEPGAMRELHWHTTADEWTFFIEGNCRMSIFNSNGARTFNYEPGDVGYVPISMGHYVENIGNTTARFLEITDSTEFEDISLTQWLALTPPEIVKAHFGIDDETVQGLSQTKNRVVPGRSASDAA